MMTWAINLHAATQRANAIGQPFHNACKFSFHWNAHYATTYSQQQKPGKSQI